MGVENQVEELAILVIELLKKGVLDLGESVLLEKSRVIYQKIFELSHKYLIKYHKQYKEKKLLYAFGGAEYFGELENTMLKSQSLRIWHCLAASSLSFTTAKHSNGG
jgi:hypothetical protein